MRRPLCDCGHDVEAHRVHEVHGWCGECSCTGFPDDYPGPFGSDGLPLPVPGTLVETLLGERPADLE